MFSRSTSVTAPSALELYTIYSQPVEKPRFEQKVSPTRRQQGHFFNYCPAQLSHSGTLLKSIQPSSAHRASRCFNSSQEYNERGWLLLIHKLPNPLQLLFPMRFPVGLL